MLADSSCTPLYRTDMVMYILGSCAALYRTILFNNNMFRRTLVPHTPVYPLPSGRRIPTGSRNRSPPQLAPTGCTSSSPASVFHRDTSDSGRRPLYGATRERQDTFCFRTESRYAVAAAQ